MINRRWYRDWIAIGLVFGFIMATCLDKSKAAPPNRKSKLPNIILIVADDFGYGDSGCYGQERIKTPYIDQLAKEGIRFTQAYAGSPMGTPSRCTLLTGKHTGHSRIRSSIQVPLEPDDRRCRSRWSERGGLR